MAAAEAFLAQLRATIRVADVLDILVVSAFVYMALRWFRRARSRLVMTGVAAVAGLYFVARMLDMYLTLYLLQAAVAVAVIALIVIFQEDIRRAFERIALAGRLGPRRGPAASGEMVDTVVTAVSTMAKRKTGALLVVLGREPLERHVTGGIVLGGRVSEPLLYSIFDHHSPGHDGAVIIDGSIVRKFAVHLPLSTAVDGRARFGTRHTAALGISERSDAFVIVVSEERGQISVAQAGALSVVDAATLERELAAFVARLAPAAHSSLFTRVFARDVGMKFLSVAIALAAWILIFGMQTETVARTLTVPIVYRDVPHDWFLEQPKPLEARVSISGPNRAFRLLVPSRVSISLDVGELRSGSQRVEIHNADIELPSGVVVQSVEPRAVTLVAWPMVPIDLTVVPQTTGHLPTGVVLRRISSEPSRVKVLVPQSERQRYATLRTDAIDLAVVAQTTTFEQALVLPKDARLADNTAKLVRVTVDVAGKAR